jgi:hypothetical protein
MHLLERAPSWFDPNATVWLDSTETEEQKKAQYRELAASKATHISREVWFEAPRRWGPPQTVHGLRKLTKLADQEFDALRQLRLQVPPTEWYARHTRRNGLQIVAHVAIIEGLEIDAFSAQGDYKPYNECRQRIVGYRDMRWPSLRYIDPEDCMLGHLRTEVPEAQGQAPQDEFYMVDIEPVF